MSSHIDISEKDRQAIEKKELNEFEQKRLRGTGYGMMVHRDVGTGWINPENIDGEPVEISWHVEDSKRRPISSGKTASGLEIEVFARRIPAGKFFLRVGDQEALIDKESFQKLFRWV